MLRAMCVPTLNPLTSYIALSTALLLFPEPPRSSPIDSLFILELHGNLIEYVMEPHGMKTAPQSDDTPLELSTTPRAQWSLVRLVKSSRQGVREHVCPYRQSTNFGLIWKSVYSWFAINPNKGSVLTFYFTGQQVQ